MGGRTLFPTAISVHCCPILSPIETGPGMAYPRDVVLRTYLGRKLRMVAYWNRPTGNKLCKLFPSQFQGWRAETLVHPM